MSNIPIIVGGARCGGSQCKTFFNASPSSLKIRITYKNGTNCNILNSVEIGKQQNFQTSSGTLEFTIPGSSVSVDENQQTQCISADAKEFWYELTPDADPAIVAEEKRKLVEKRYQIKTVQIQAINAIQIKKQNGIKVIQLETDYVNSLTAQIKEIDIQLNGTSPIMRLFKIAKNGEGMEGITYLEQNFVFLILKGKVKVFTEL